MAESFDLNEAIALRKMLLKLQIVEMPPNGPDRKFISGIWPNDPIDFPVDQQKKLRRLAKKYGCEIPRGVPTHLMIEHEIERNHG